MQQLEKSPITRETLTKAEVLQFWPKGQPEALVFASASLRKGLLLNLWLQWLLGVDPTESTVPGFVGSATLDFSNPIAFQQSVEAEIRNGDGTAKESVVIGYFYGVPLLLEPQDGETRSNEAIDESKKKIVSVQEKYKDHDVVIFACDTVGEIEKSDGSRVRTGKPRNEEGFSDLVERVGLEVAKLFYLWDHYWRADGKPVGLDHKNGLVAGRFKPGNDNPELYEHVSILHKEVPHDFEMVFRFLKIFFESGGGGVFQQLIDWTEDVLTKISNEEMRSKVMRLPEGQRPWYFMIHIMGMQAWQLLDMLSEVAGLQYTDSETESVVL